MRRLRNALLACVGIAVAAAGVGLALLPPGLLASLGDGATIVWYGPDFPPDETHTYARTPTRPLRVHIYRAGADRHAGATVVLFHGGGFHSGWPEELFPLSRRLADAGHTVFVPEYRLQRADGVAYAQQLADCRAAVAWVGAEAGRFGGDPVRLVLGGSSAGAHLAAALVALPADDAAPRPRAIGLLLAAPYVDSGDASERFAADAAGRGFVERWLLGEARDVFEGASHDWSPREHLHRAMPPVLMLVGEEDRLHAPARGFCAAVRAQGSECRLKAYPAAGHAFALYGYEHHERFVADVQEGLAGWLE